MIENVSEQDTEENICTYEMGKSKSMEKFT
jgi:hypothetical protein